MDIGDTIAPNSDQMDAVDLVGGPQTFTVEGASRGSSEQPVNIILREFPRPWRPGKSMRRILVAIWGADASTYAGNRLTLYCDPEVRFGGVAVGGVRIAAMSGIDKPRSVPLIISRGKSALFTVQPLAAPFPQQDDGLITSEQSTHLFDGLKTLGKGDRETGLEYISQIVGHPVASTKELTQDDAADVIAAIKTDIAAREAGEQS